MDVELLPMTRERMHELFRGFSLDPAIFADMSLYEQKKNYVYDPEKVDALFEMRSAEKGSIAFAIMLDGTVIGEVGLRHFSEESKECKLSIHLQNDAVSHPYYVRLSRESAWLAERTVEKWNTGVLTKPVPVSEMHAFAASEKAAGASVFFAAAE